MLGWRPPQSSKVWPLVIILLLGWMGLNWVCKRVHLEESVVGVYRLELFSLVDALEASQRVEFPKWQRWLGELDHLPLRLEEVMKESREAGIQMPGVFVDHALVWMVVHESQVATHDGSPAISKAHEWLALADPSEDVAYRPHVEAWLEGRELDPIEKQSLTQLCQDWSMDWAVQRLATRFAIEGAVAPTESLTNGRQRCLGRVISGGLMLGCLIVAVVGVLLVATFKRWPSQKGSQEARWIKLVPPAVLLLAFALIELGLLLIHELGKRFSSELMAESSQDFAGYYRAWWASMLIFIGGWLVVPRAMISLCGLGQVAVGRVVGWRWNELRQPQRWVVAMAIACVLLVAATALDRVVMNSGADRGGAMLDSLSFSMMGTSAGQWLVLALWAVVLGPVLEEWLFRGLIFRGLKGAWGIKVALVLSAGLFAAGHGYSLEGTWVVFGFGLVFGLIYMRTGSLVTTALVHCFHNGMLLVVTSLGGVL